MRHYHFLTFIRGILFVVLTSLGAQSAQALEDVVPIVVGTFHPELGWTAKPSSRASSSRTGSKIDYIINEHGFREIDNTGAKADCGVVVLGDSNTYGYGIAMSEHWLTRLRERYPDFMIYNLGVSGYGVDQELHRFRLDGAPLKPKLVIAYIPHFADDRHMHAYRFGEAKLFYTAQESGPLKLQTAHVKRDRRLFEKKLLIAWDSLTKEVTALFNDWDQMTRQMGLKIIKEMESDSKAIGAEFLLLSWKELCEQNQVSHCLDVEVVEKYPIITSSGEDLRHVNAEGSMKMASLIARYIEKENLVSECLSLRD